MSFTEFGNAASMELILSIALGIGLSAASGFRVFVPLLGLSIATLAGQVSPAPGFEWIGNWAAVVAFATATVLEISAYYIPWLDNLLDTLTGPLAIVAGALATISVVDDMSPFLRWTLAIIGGGGAAAIVQSGTSLLRLGSTSVSAGFTNPVVATAELAGSSILTVLALLLPLLAAALALIVIVFVAVRMKRRFVKKVPGG
jgi:hypothetical protein